MHNRFSLLAKVVQQASYSLPTEQQLLTEQVCSCHIVNDGYVVAGIASSRTMNNQEENFMSQTSSGFSNASLA